MEENQFQATSSEQAPVVNPTASNVSFPSVNQQPKKSGSSKTLLILGVLVVVGVIGFLMFRSSAQKDNTQTLGTSDEQAFATIEPIQKTPQPSPTATAKPVDKSLIKIEIQNGTGITGEAAYLQNQLKLLDYDNFTVGNATSQDQTTTGVTFSKSLAQSVVDELTVKLKEIYKTVEVKTASTSKTDVLIVTGLRKGATSKAVATTTPKASATPTSSSKASSTPVSTP